MESPVSPVSSVSSRSLSPDTFQGSYDTAGLAANPEADVRLEQDDVERVPVPCQWKDCGEVFEHLRDLVRHIEAKHVGNNKIAYRCQWNACSRKGLDQTSKWALVTHIRSHTGEKPYTCPVVDCDRSFTRQDALAKHLRGVHDIDQRKLGSDMKNDIGSTKLNNGGTLKRKFDEVDYDPATGAVIIGGVPYESREDDRMEQEYDADNDFDANGFNRNSSEHSPTPVRAPSPPSDEGNELPPSLADKVDEHGLVYGLRPQFAKYIIMKAKHRYVSDEKRLLTAELAFLKKEEERVAQSKDAILDRVIISEIGNSARSIVGKVKPEHVRENGNQPFGVHRAVP